jgi:hypothetical protein
MKGTDITKNGNGMQWLRMPQILYCQQVADTTLSIEGKLQYGQIVIRLQRKDNKEKLHSLCCQAQATAIERVDLNFSVGAVLAQVTDTVSPEVCKKRGYREDGKGYRKTLTITMMEDRRVRISISCMLYKGNADGSIQVFGDYNHTESIIIAVDDLYRLREKVHLTHQAALREWAVCIKERTRAKSARNDERMLDV